MTLSIGLDFIGMGAFTPASSTTSLLLDELGVTAAVAYSTRKLRSAYAGSAIRVRRSSDDTEQDIGFVGEDLDSASLTSFVGAGNGFIKTWYDQSGNANNATQATLARQPKIVSSGTIYTLSSKPALFWDGGYWLGPGTVIDTSSQTMSAVCVGEGTGGSATYRTFFSDALGGSWHFRVDNNDVVTSNRANTANLFSTTGTVAAGANCVIGVSTTGSQIIRINGSEESNSTSSAFTNSIDTIGGEGTVPSQPWDKELGEIVIFQSVLSAGNRSTAYSNVKAYWGTP